MLEVVNRERGDDGIEAPKRWQWLGEIVLDELDALHRGEPLARCTEHEPGEVEADAKHLRAIGLEKGEQAAIARAEIEDATSVARHLFKQNALPLYTMRKLVRATEVATDPLLVGRPLLAGHAALSPLVPSRSKSGGPYRTIRST